MSKLFIILAASAALAGIVLAPVHVASFILSFCGITILYRNSDVLIEILEALHLRAAETPLRELIPEDALRRAAVHEAGHAVAEWHTPGYHVAEISISPYDGEEKQGGNTVRKPAVWTAETFYEAIAVLMAGRAAETILFGEPSAGDANDVSEATNFARRLICDEGLSPKFGIVAYDLQLTSYTRTDAIMDEARRMVENGYRRALDLLARHRPALERVTEALAKEHHLTHDRIKQLIEG